MEVSIGDTDGEEQDAWIKIELLRKFLSLERVVAGIHEFAPLSTECAQGWNILCFIQWTGHLKLCGKYSSYLQAMAILVLRIEVYGNTYDTYVFRQNSSYFTINVTVNNQYYRYSSHETLCQLYINIVYTVHSWQGAHSRNVFYCWLIPAMLTLENQFKSNGKFTYTLRPLLHVFTL